MTLSSLVNIDWLGVAGLLVAIGALVQSHRAIKQADESMRLNQRHMELSVRPSLTGHYILLTDRVFAIDIENRGLGPAIVTNWEVWSENSPNDVLSAHQSSILEKFLASKVADPNLPFVHSVKKLGSYIPAGEKWRLFELVTNTMRDQKLLQAVNHDVSQISIRIEYESMYGEKFSETVSYRKNSQPQSVLP